MHEFFYPLTLLIVGLALIVAETMIPSAGLLGVLAAISLMSSVAAAYYYGGVATGTIFLLGTFIGVWSFIVYLVRKWPKSLIGRRILVEPPPPSELLPDRSELHDMVGRVGQAISLMLPSGYVEIDGRRFDATGPTTIEAGTWVKVVGVRSGMNLIVQPVSMDESAANAAGGSEQVIEDPFDGPLG